MSGVEHAPPHQVLVSGATGFIGQHLVPLLLQAGHEVVALARDAERARRFEWFGHVRFVTHDLDADAPLPAVQPGAGLIHLAWQGLPHYQSLHHFERNLPHNYRFIKSLVQAGVRQVLVTGTCLEYGFQSGAIASSAPAQPANPYAAAKNSLRQGLEFLAEEAGFALQWARLFYMHGAGQSPSSVLSQLEQAMERGDEEFRMSGGEQLRDYLPVQAVAHQLVRLYSSRGAGTYNVCSGRPISVRRLVEERLAQCGSGIRLRMGFYPYPRHEPLAFWGVPDLDDTERACSLPLSRPTS